jgi:hypothetical protein
MQPFNYYYNHQPSKCCLVSHAFNVMSLLVYAISPILPFLTPPASGMQPLFHRMSPAQLDDILATPHPSPHPLPLVLPRVFT